MRLEQTDPRVIDKAMSEVLPNYKTGSFLGFFDDPEFKLPTRPKLQTDNNGVEWEWNGQEPYESKENWSPK